MSPPSPPPPGWFPDPDGHGLRWWDGERWTEHYHQPDAVHQTPLPSQVPSRLSGVSISRPNRNPTPMDAWNGLMTGGHWVIVVVLLFMLVSLSLMLIATLAGASTATAQDIAAKVIVYGGLALLGLRFLASR